MGYVILIILSVLATVSALVAGFRLYGDRPLTALIAAMGIWMLIIGVPPFLLGWLGVLTSGTVGVGAAIVSLATLAAAVWRIDEHRGAFVKKALLTGVNIPLRGLKMAWQERSLVLLGLIAVPVIAIWTAFLAYIAPSSSWDGLWYHESIVGFAIQNQGFEWVDVPRRMEFVNGYPRMSEMFNLFAVIFSGRYLVDIVPSFMMIIAFASMVGLSRPLVAKPTHAMGWASVLVLLPAVVLQLRSSLTDVTFLAGFLSALFFLTRPRFRTQDMVLGALLTGMMGTMKGTGIAIAPILFAVGAVRVIRYGMKKRSLHALLPLVAIVLAAGVLVAPTYVRNWTKQDNPFWPLGLDIAGISFEGPNRLKMHRPRALTDLISPPRIPQYADTRDNGYGNLPPLLLPPLVLAALGLLIWQLAHRKRTDAHLTLVLAILAIVPPIAVSPVGLWWARLNLHWVAVSILLVAWFVGSANRRTLAEGVLGALIVGSLLTLVWSGTNWGVKAKVLFEIIDRPPQSRDQFKLSGRMPPENIAIARDRDLKEGAVVVYDGAYRFPTGLWNLALSNRLVYIPQNRPADHYLTALDDVGAVWAVVRKDSPADEKLGQSKTKWHLVGDLRKLSRVYVRK